MHRAAARRKKPLSKQQLARLKEENRNACAEVKEMIFDFEREKGLVTHCTRLSSRWVATVMSDVSRLSSPKAQR